MARRAPRPEHRPQPAQQRLELVHLPRRDVLRFTRPPVLAQDAIFGPPSVLARAAGRDPLAQ
jgi:hypothetical protein